MDDEGFLGRWSRLKREAVEPRPEAEEDAPPDATTPAAPEPPPLPPIESLGADSDYTGFLAPGVPAELTRMALRKAWVSDPAIAQFRGFADYDWDCNAPGYGQLLPTDNVAKLLDAVFGDQPPEKAPQPAPDTAPEMVEEPAGAVPVAEVEDTEDTVRDQTKSDGETFEA